MVQRRKEEIGASSDRGYSHSARKKNIMYYLNSAFVGEGLYEYVVRIDRPDESPLPPKQNKKKLQLQHHHPFILTPPFFITSCPRIPLLLHLHLHEPDIPRHRALYHLLYHLYVWPHNIIICSFAPHTKARSPPPGDAPNHTWDMLAQRPYNLLTIVHLPAALDVNSGIEMANHMDFALFCGAEEDFARIEKVKRVRRRSRRNGWRGRCGRGGRGGMAARLLEDLGRVKEWKNLRFVSVGGVNDEIEMVMLREAGEEGNSVFMERVVGSVEIGRGVP